MKTRYLSSLIALGFAAVLFGPSPAMAQVVLGPTLSQFAVLGATPNVTCTGASLVTGDVGVSPAAAIIGFPAPCTLIGTPHAADVTAAQAQAELTTAYLAAAALPPASAQGPDLTGLTLVPGVYTVAGAPSNLTGTLILNAQGNPNATWTFQMSSSLITSSGASVVFINGTPANACGVTWQVTSSATLGTGTTFVGNILALTSVFMNTGANLSGRALARNGQVTMDTNNVSITACGILPTPSPTPTPVPTLPQIGAWALILALLAGGAYLVGRRTPTEASR
jgi:hypothetical protein